MISFSRILFPTEFADLGEKAINYVMRIVRKTGGELVLFHAISRPSGLTRIFSGDDTQERFDEATGKLKALGKRLDPDGIMNISFLLGEGVPEQAIVMAADEHDIDFIVMGTKGGAGLRDSLLGSAVNYVIREANCPVLTIRNQSDTPKFKRILVPMDYRKDSAGKIFWGTQFALMSRAKLIFYGVLTGDHDFNEEIIQHCHSAASYARQMDVRDVQETVDPTSEKHEVAIEKYAKHIGADLICIMAYDDTRPGLIRSVAEKLANSSQVPVLFAHPDPEYMDQVW